MQVLDKIVESGSTAGVVRLKERINRRKNNINLLIVPQTLRISLHSQCQVDLKGRVQVGGADVLAETSVHPRSHVLAIAFEHAQSLPQHSAIADNFQVSTLPQPGHAEVVNVNRFTRLK